MSSIYSAASAVSASDSKEPGCEPSRSARSIRAPGRSSAPTGPMSPSMTTCKPSPPSASGQTELFLISSAGDFPAKTPALDRPNGESASVSKGRGLGFGGKCDGWPLNFHAPSSSWRMCQASLVPDGDVFSETWPRSGVMRNGVCYAEQISDCPSLEDGSSLLPRPAARDGKDVSSTSAHLAARQRHQPSAATRLLERGVNWKLISRAYELMMGFPSRWSEAAYTTSATPSRRRSRKQSVNPSCKEKD